MIEIDTAQLIRDKIRIGGKFRRMMDMLEDVLPDVVNPVIIALMQQYPVNSHTVTRAMAYSQWILTTRKGRIIRGYKSWRQYRYVMMLASTGRLPYRRTYAMRRAWRVVGRGRDSRVVNETDAARYSMSPSDQARLNRMVGWTTTQERLDDPGKTVRDAIRDGLQETLRRVGLRG